MPRGRPRGPCSEQAHYIVKFLFDEATRQGVSVDELSQRSGIYPGTLNSWKRAKHDATLSLIEASLNSIGYCISVKKK